ncbi:MAG: hypothetical protein KDC28_05355 [Saprospiraceae bacterium]|nr:hypothetical protein [Saprospiraceae bacterium]MCB9321045.1 hypothetical protein [Lewinellaceae bacterium]
MKTKPISAWILMVLLTFALLDGAGGGGGNLALSAGGGGNFALSAGGGGH